MNNLEMVKEYYPYAAENSYDFSNGQGYVHMLPKDTIEGHTLNADCTCKPELITPLTAAPAHYMHHVCEPSNPVPTPRTNPHYHIPDTKQYPEPCGHYVLIKIPEVQSVSEGGIILHSKTQEKREQEGMEVGEVMAFGPTAYTGWGGFEGAEAWGIAVGDTVEFKKYEGKRCYTEGYEDFHYIPDSVLIGCNRSAIDE